MAEDMIVKELDDVVVRFSGDSGDGMQLAGNMFSNISATEGNDISTFPDYPADIRAPQGTLTGVSGFQVHIGSGKVYTPGDKCDVLVAMNPAALKTQYKFCKPQSVIIIDTDSFTKRDLEKAQFVLENPFSELGIKIDVVEAAITTMCKESLKDSGLDNKTIMRTKNMFALGLVCWLFHRDIHVGEKILREKFAKKPEIAEANVKVLYDGYHFGNIDIYCPWDVIQYCKSLYLDVSAKPQDFWSNSSGNAIVRRFIDKADISTRNEIERLIAGESIAKDVVSELTYDEIDKSIENLWSVLFTTGYLTHKGCTESGKYRLVIPNKEVRNLFVKKIREWFSDVSRNDGKILEEFCSAFVDKDSEKIEQIFGDYLWNTISIRDTAVAKEKKENFYHGILLGLLGYKSNWLIKSNAESGIGYSDILVEVPTNRTGIVIEIKYAEDGNLDAACEKALKQIEEKDYVAKLKQDGMKNFIKYGIACFKKICKVEVE